MKGIILAGGSGTRLHPITLSINKHLLPVYDKAMIYYPLSILMLAHIKDILLVTDKNYIDSFYKILNNGKQWGLNIQYAEQEEPRGIAEALIIAEEFIGNDSVCLALGDNFFYGNGLSSKLLQSAQLTTGCILYGYKVKDPSRYGIVELDTDMSIKSIQEKPEKPLSNTAITGLYFFDNQASSIAKKISPSSRGELEITSINREYLKKGQVNLEILGRGFAWIDMGTHDSLLEASQFVQTIEKRQKYKIACLEEISFQNKWIGESEILKIIEQLKNNSYSDYLKDLIELK